MNAVARWWQMTSAGMIVVTQTVHLLRRSDDKGWYGKSYEQGWEIRIGVLDPLPDYPTYRIRVNLYRDGHYFDHVSFDHLQPPNETRWDTKTLEYNFEPSYYFANVRIQG